MDDAFDLTTTFADAPAIDTVAAKELAKAEKRRRKSEAKLQENRENREKRKREKDRKKQLKKREIGASDEEEQGDETEANGANTDDEESGQPTSKKQKTGKGEPDLYKRGEYGVWIGNLAWTTTEKTVRQHLADCGEITRVHMPPNSNKKYVNKGFAYVDFSTAEGMQAAIALSEKYLDHRCLLIKSSKDFNKTGRPKREDVNSEKVGPHGASPTLFVGNLSFNTTIEGLEKLFSPSGQIRKVRLATFEDSGKCKGFGYIDFMEVASATAALNDKKTHFLDGRRLRIEYASEDATKRGTPWLLRKEKQGQEHAEGTESPAVEQEKEIKEKPKKKRVRKEKRIPAAPFTPGAALATAQRASVAAVPFEGTKTSFD